MSVLAIIPAYVSQPQDIELLNDCVSTLRATAPKELEILVISDGSPARDLMTTVELICDEHGAGLIDKEENEGFSRTVNIGLRRALADGHDALLVNADIEFIPGPWFANMVNQRELLDGHDGPAAIVGAKLLFPSGLIQHGGVYFSLLTRTFDHLFKYGPHDLAEANVPSICPVTAALQLIRWETLTSVGLYDEDFKMGWEDVDYCLRTLQSGREVVYAPNVVAYHHESVFRGRPNPKVQAWTWESFRHLAEKWSTQSFAGLVPQL